MPDRIDRRSFLARGAVGAAGVAAAGLGGGGLLAACSSGGSGTPKATGPRNGITSATPKKGGSLIFGVEAEETSFDPAVGRFDETGVLYARTVFDPLTIIAEDGSVQPYLAQSVTPNEDYTTWTIGVRPGVLFHDGTTCDAAAIAGSLEHFLTGELGITLTPSLTKPTANAITAGSDTVTITLNQPWVPFPAYLTGGIGGQGGYIIAPSMIANKNGGMNPVGTGPFVFDDWVPNSHFTSKRNPHYWRTGQPYLDQITYMPIVDADSRASSLKSGTIDIMHTDVPEVILQFRDDDNYGFIDDSLHVVGEPDMNFIMCNLSKEPVSNIKVRRAMAMAIDSKAYSRIIDLNVNAPTNQPFVPGSPYYAPDSGYPAFNVEGAKALVKEVENETGKPVSFSLSTTTSGSSIQAAEYLQARLQAVGMQVSLVNLQQSDEINDALAGDFETVSWRQFAAVDPDLNYLWWSPTEIFGSGKNEINPNFAQNHDPEMEVLLQRGRQSTDPAVRDKAYQQIAQRLNVDLPYIWNDRATWSIVAAGNVQNFNNPTTPAGGKAYGMIVGTVWTSQIWIDT